MKRETEKQMERKVYSVPQLTEYGTIEELTQGIKNKKFGGSDDVILIGIGPVLANAS